jgi:hypothetical protein
VSAVIGELHFEGCGGCLFNGDDGCDLDQQELVDNLNIEGGNCVCCGCFQALERGAPGGRALPESGGAE